MSLNNSHTSGAALKGKDKLQRRKSLKAIANAVIGGISGNSAGSSNGDVAKKM